MERGCKYKYKPYVLTLGAGLLSDAVPSSETVDSSIFMPAVISTELSYVRH